MKSRMRENRTYGSVRGDRQAFHIKYTERSVEFAYSTKNMSALEYTIQQKFISYTDKTMANGMRNLSHKPLTESEIEFVKNEIKRIKADETVFVFNDEDHINTGTCYNYTNDKIYVTKNVFPDDQYASIHPRDIMSVAAVLAHEYYGHRSFRNEYLNDLKINPDFHTTPIWQDECRASLYAAQFTPNLNQIERRDLIQDAIFRAKEYGQLIEMNSFMKEVLYGYKNERSIVPQYEQPRYIDETNQERTEDDWENYESLSDMSYDTKCYDHDER